MKYVIRAAMAVALGISSQAVFAQEDQNVDLERCSRCERAIHAKLSEIQRTAADIRGDTSGIGAKLDALNTSIQQLTAAVQQGSKKSAVYINNPPVTYTMSMLPAPTINENANPAAATYCRSINYKAGRAVTLRPPVALPPQAGAVTSLVCYD